MMMKVNKEINYKKFEDKLLNIYPQLTDKQAEKIIKQLFNFWWNMIKNLDKFENGAGSSWALRQTLVYQALFGEIWRRTFANAHFFCKDCF